MWNPGVGSRAEGARLGKPGVTDFVGIELLVPAQGDGINLSTRFYLHGHQLSTSFGWELQPGEKGDLAIWCSLNVQGTFRLSQGFYAVCWDDMNAILGAPKGGMLVMRSVILMGDTLWDVLWDWLWLWLQWCNCMMGIDWSDILCIWICCSQVIWLI